MVSKSGGLRGFVTLFVFLALLLAVSVFATVNLDTPMPGVWVAGNNGSVPFRFNITSASDGLVSGPVSCNLTLNSQVVATNSSMVNDTTTVLYSNTSFSLGSNTWSVTCSNTTHVNQSEPRTFYYDALPPAVTIEVANHTWYDSATPNVSFNISDDADDPLNFTFFVDGSPDISGESANDTVNSSAALSSLPEGAHTVLVSAVDELIQHQTNTSLYTIYVDTVAPSVTLESPPDGQTVMAADPSLQFNVVDAQGGPYNCSLYVDGAYQSSNASTLNATSTTFSYSFSEGTHTWNVTCFDNASNVGSDQRTLTYDLTAPVPVITTSNHSWFSDLTPAISFNITDDLASTLSYQFIVDGIFDAVANGTVSNASGGSDDLDTLGVGMHPVILQANDSGMNFGNSSVTVIFVDNQSPDVTPVSPADGSTSYSEVQNLTFSMRDNMGGPMYNCSLYINGTYNRSVMAANDTNTQFSDVILNHSTYRWNVTCLDNASNEGSGAYTLTTASQPPPAGDFNFSFNGTVYDSTGDNLLSDATVIVKLYNMTDGFSLVYTYTNTTNSTGGFSLDLAAWNSGSYMYGAELYKDAGGSIYAGKPLPEFPYMEFSTVSPVDFYLKPGAKVNVTVLNSTGDRVAFNYQLKDENLGYPIAEDFENTHTQKSIYVQTDRNYSVMVYPEEAMPRSQPVTSLTAHATTDVEFNATEDVVTVSGNASLSNGSASMTSFHVIPMLIEPGNNVFVDYSIMPYNMSAWEGGSDSFDTGSGAYSIGLPSVPSPGIDFILFYVAEADDGETYGFFRNITLTYGQSAVSGFDAALQPLAGDASTYTFSQDSGTGGPGRNTTVLVANFSLINASGYPVGSAFVEAILDYTDVGGPSFSMLKDVGSSDGGRFQLPLLADEDVKVQIFSGNYAPKKKSISGSSLDSDVFINMTAFNPGDIEGALGSSDIFVDMIVSNSTCNVPDYPSGCSLFPSGRASFDSFNPLSVVMGGGDISFVMGRSSNNITVMYKDADLLASGPPDVLFDDEAESSGSGNILAEAWRFGSAGPEIYDEVLIGFPYNSSFAPGTMNVSVPYLYDESDWSLLWNVSANGTAGIATNLTDYADFNTSWFDGTMPCSTSDASAECYIDTSSSMMWLTIPHFTGSEYEVQGMTPESNAPNVTGNQTNVSGAILSSTGVLINATVVDDTNVTNVTVGYTTLLEMSNNSASGYYLETTPSALGCSGVGACVLTFNATDYWNNTNASVVTSFLIDDYAPAPNTPSINASVSYRNVTNTTTIQVNITAADVGAAGTANVTVANGSTVQMTSLGSDLWQANTTPQELGCGTEGACTLYFTATDSLGTSNSTMTATIVVDETNPEVSGPSVAPSEVRSASSMQVNVTVTDDSAIGSVSVNGSSMSVLSGDTYSLTTTPANLSCSEGTCTLGFTASDEPGNSNSTTSTTVTVDDTAPSVAFVYNSTSLTNSTNSLTLNVTVSEENTVSSVTANGFAMSSPSADGNYTVAVNASTLNCETSGTCTVTFNATDTAGNSGTNSTSITVDNDGPAVTSPGVTNATEAKNSTVVNIQVDASDSAASVHTVLVNSQPMYLLNASASTYHANLSGETLGCGPDGACTLTFVANDTLGNFNGTTTTSYTIDTTGPTNTSAFSVSEGSSSATVSATFNETANCTVVYGTDETNLSSSASSSSFATTGAVSLSGLSASTVYYYNVTTCVDDLGNSQTLDLGTFNFTTTAASTPSSGGGGGGGSYESEVTYEIGDVTGAETSLEMGRGDEMKFSHGDGSGSKEEHTLTVKSLGGSYADFEIASEVQSFRLFVGQSRSVDVDSDGSADVRVSLLDIVSRKAMVKITSLVTDRDRIELLPPAKPSRRSAEEHSEEEVVAGQDVAPEPSAAPGKSSEPASAPAPETVEDGAGLPAYWYVFGGLVVIVVIIIIAALIFEKRGQGGSSGGL